MRPVGSKRQSRAAAAIRGAQLSWTTEEETDENTVDDPENQGGDNGGGGNGGNNGGGNPPGELEGEDIGARKATTVQRDQDCER